MKNQFKILLIAIIIGAAGTYRLYEPSTQTSAATIEGIAEKIIRFHVIANSDSDEDQELKLKVKNKVIDYASDLLTDSTSVDETRTILNNNMQAINSIATSIIEGNGYDYKVNSSITNCYFPTKSYGDVTFPPGEYEAFRIVIGEGEGKNWWCVMYPPLCFIDASHGVLPDSSKKDLQSVLSDVEYSAITMENCHDEDITFRFKYLTFLNFIFE